MNHHTNKRARNRGPSDADVVSFIFALHLIHYGGGGGGGGDMSESSLNTVCS